MILDPIGGPAELAPDSSDRLLLVAPHPDDEALAAGGLLELAARRGAAVRVLYVTRGENNPWAQRARERRLRIGPRDRARWGERRWAEALSALERLGLPPDCARCLELPDQGLSNLLFRGDPALIRGLEEELASWRPTVVLAPAVWDGHPDHSAMGLVIRLARIPEADAAPLVLQYAVHRRTEPDRAGSVRVRLDDRMRSRKREAILCHRSQVALRRDFLLRFVEAEERFVPLRPGAAEVYPHPIRSAEVVEGLARIEIARPLPPGLGRPELVILIAGAAGEAPAPGGGNAPAPSGGNAPPRAGEVRWRTLRVELNLARRMGIARPGREDAAPFRLPLRVESRGFRIEVPLQIPAGNAEAAAAFANVIRPAMRRLGFFDAVGWRIVREPVRPPETRVRESRDSVPEQEDARIGANSLAGVVAAQGFEPRTKGL